jgi:hypothetical protein
MELPKTIDEKTEPVPAQQAAPSPVLPQEKAIAQTPEPAIDVDKLPKTGGEKFYDGFQFVFGKVFIIAITAVLAFTSDQKYGPKKIGPVPNYLKKFQGWFHDKLLHNKVYPLEKKGDFANLFAGAAASTMTLSHGGNFFAPFIRWLENDREGISNAWNRKFGTEEDVKIAHERLKDIPKQNWMDVAKGRAMAWGTVFGAILTSYAVVGKNKKSNRYWLDEYEDFFARKLAGTVKSGRDIAAVPLSKPLSEVQRSNKMYRFGKVLALDLYATTAGILIWNFFSRKSAMKRSEKEEIAANKDLPHEFILTETLSGPEAGKPVSKAATVKEQPEEAKAATAASKPEKEERADLAHASPGKPHFLQNITPRQKPASLGPTHIAHATNPELHGSGAALA